MALELEKFNPSVAELQELVAAAGMLTLPDPTDEVQLKAVKDKRIQLRDARVRVEKAGKELRQEAIDFQKTVLTREKELIAIIEPEEQRLKGLEEEAKHIVMMNKRRESLPARKERLLALGEEYVSSDEGLLLMDDVDFEHYYNTSVASKNDKATAEIEKRERAVREAEEKEQREKEMKEREEAARKEAEERGKREIAEAEERARLAEQKAKENAEREAREKEEREKAERERLAKEDRIRVTLEMHGYTEATKSDFIIQRAGDKIDLFKKIASLDIQ